MSHLASIIIPCHNAGRFLDETLRSALAQDWPRIEIIIVDDHSSDHSREIAAGYSGRNVRLLASSSRGAAAARNRGLAAAKGDLIQFLDADDLLSPDKISAQMTVLEQSPPGCVALSATTSFQDGSDPEQGVRQDEWPIVDSDDPLDWLIELLGPDGRGGMVHPASWLSPRSVVVEAGPWDERLSLDDDGEYFSRVVLASKGLRRSHTGRSYYRKYAGFAGNLSGQKSALHQRSALLALDLRGEKIFALTPGDRAKRALARCYLELAFSAYPFSPEVTDLAVRRSEELGSRDRPRGFVTRSGLIMEKLLGWKAARRTQILYRQCVQHLKFS